MAKFSLNLGQKQSLVTSLSAAVAAFLVLVLITLALFIFIRGSHYFWPQNIQTIKFYTDDAETTDIVYAVPVATTNRINEALLHYRYSSKSALYDGQMTLNSDHVVSISPTSGVANIKLKNGGRVIGKLQYLTDVNGQQVPLTEFQRLQQEVAQLVAQTEQIRRNELASIHSSLADMDRKGVEKLAPARVRLERRFGQLQARIDRVFKQIDNYLLTVQFADQSSATIGLHDVVDFHYPNQMGVTEKLLRGLQTLGTFISESPKLDNTTGGVFPALFGTVVMVLMMTIIVTPLGVLAAVYLYEYAPQNRTTSFIRISVNNLAGVPSIVYGVFGLGFFVYGVGGNIDQLFFSDRLPAPTFGAPGIFWASLTMAILTLPVVIVSTEEGLRRVPSALRDGSFALGATQSETIFKMILPIASPGIMTGVILAIARGAGEVAPLMLVGAVKFAPALPVDGEFPFIHVYRQFMHLGVLIYDGAFHSQNVGNGSSFVFACCMLLLFIVLCLNLAAIVIRNRLRKAYAQN